MSKIKIIYRLWSHINDLILYIKGQTDKTIEQIEDEIDVTEYCCRPYTQEEE